MIRENLCAGFAIICVSLCLTTTSNALPDPITVQYNLPSLDRWNYPFNLSPGTRPNASLFAPYIGEELSPDFDNRDAQFHVAFNTAGDIETGLGPASYLITQAKLTVQVSNNNQFRYDPTYDPWQTYLPSSDPEFFPDTTLGRPIELYGVGFRHGFDELSYQENTAFVPSGFGIGIGKYIRTTYALDFDEDGLPRDVSNNVDEGFDPFPFAIGAATLNPGAFVPTGTVFTFEIDVDDEFVQQYLAAQLDLGKVHFMLASLHTGSEDESGNFPEFYTKENSLVNAGLRQAARLSLTVEFVDDPGKPGIDGDLNNDGIVDGLDLLILLSAWGTCEDPANCPADINNDNTVDGLDLLILLSNWS